MFEVLATCGRARAGVLSTAHGDIETPVFMPVGTRGTVRGLLPRDLRDAGAQILLANAYHLFLRPGDEGIRDLGGLHGFTGWKGPWITDSGGFQVFSLTDLVKVGEEGVEFRSPVDPSARLMPLARPPAGADAALIDLVETLNENADKLNARLFTYQDYAAVGRR